MELVVVQVELGQTDEVAEPLGQFSCKTSENVSKIDNTMYVGAYNSPVKPLPGMGRSWSSVPFSFFSYWAFSLTSKWVKLVSCPSSLGNFPAKSENASKHTTHVIPMLGHTNLTAEAHAVQNELLELDKDCHVHCNGPAQVAAAQVELFEFCERRK